MPRFCNYVDSDGEYCEKFAKCNFPGQTGRVRCGEHKEPDMVYFSQTKCKYTYIDENNEKKQCITKPFFNFEGHKGGVFCVSHKLPGMVDVATKKCENKDCKIQPAFNYLGKKSGRFCFKHKLEGMLDVKRLLCTNCKINRIRRPSHPIYKDHCVFCYFHLNPGAEYARDYKTKEGHVIKALLEKIEKNHKDIDINNFITDKIVNGGCSKRRPDLMYDCLTHWICIENDENEHTDYSLPCEETRVNELFTDMADRKMVLIRFNCDSYTKDNMKQPSIFKQDKNGISFIADKKEFNERIDMLYQTVIKHIKNIPSEEGVTYEYLYYSDK
jgi:hypothetical protein